MSCHHYQKEMLVFDLLDTPEQARLQEHLTTCATCQAEWFKIEKLNSRLTEIRQRLTVPENPVQLTDQIMTVVIETKRGKDRQKNSKEWFFDTYWRLGFAGISMCLIVLFLVEFTTPMMDAARAQNIGIQKITLKGDWLKTKIGTRIQSNINNQPCIAKNTNDLACLKSNLHRLIRTIDSKN